MAVPEVIDAPPGNMVIILGAHEAKRKLRKADSDIDDWLYELTDELAFFAADRLRHHAPGSIDRLVGVHVAHTSGLGFEATAGVEPDFSPSNFGRGLGSDPSDYPVFVDVGTGIFGEKRMPITTIPGHVMGPIHHGGKVYWVNSYQGQPAQHYSDKSHRDTVEWAGPHIELAMPDLQRKIDG